MAGGHLVAGVLRAGHGHPHYAHRHTASLAVPIYTSGINVEPPSHPRHTLSPQRASGAAPVSVQTLDCEIERFGFPLKGEGLVRHRVGGAVPAPASVRFRLRVPGREGEGAGEGGREGETSRQTNRLKL